MSKSLNLLKENISKRVIVLLKQGYSISGELWGFDLFLNLLLKNAIYTWYDEEGNEYEEKYEKVLVRGDNVMAISPS